jgi:hypothetical protein
VAVLPPFMGMAASLAVVWKEGEHPPAVGRLELRSDQLHLEGGCGGCGVSENVALSEIERTHIGRSPEERIDGHQALVLERVNGRCPLLISCVFGVGALAELVELLGG